MAVTNRAVRVVKTPVISRVAMAIREISSITGSSISIMATIMEEIHMIQEVIAVEPVICAVTCGVPIPCVNVWEVTFVHASKV